MQIFVSNSSGQTAYTVDAETSIESLKLMIENKEFLPSHLFTLVNGSSLVECGTIAGNGIMEEDTLALMFQVNAGMRAKWRKKRMRRLRRKRRKMRMRAR
jgi:small subunit ribosomal protein S27Ae